MSTNFPTSLDSFNNPNATDKLNSPSHSSQHGDINDAMEAVQAKLGVNGSAVTTSIDYIVNALTTALANIAGVPVGAIAMYGQGFSIPPTGWLVCNGAAISRSTYSSLFGVIGTTFGVGDGSTTFNLPDLVGRAPIGAGLGSGLTNRPLGSTGGAETVALSTAELPSHSHTVGGTGFYPTAIVANNPGGGAASGNVITVTGTAATSSTGSGTAHANMQPWSAVMFIIYAGA